MSDLDADLYGDLYGNDEGDFNEQAQDDQQEVTDAGAEYDTVDTKVAPNGATTETSTTASSTQPAPVASKPVTSSIQSYTSQPQQLQQIPTYEEPQPAAQSTSRPDTDFSKMAANDRSVRPSEMKDEG